MFTFRFPCGIWVMLCDIYRKNHFLVKGRHIFIASVCVSVCVCVRVGRVLLPWGQEVVPFYHKKIWEQQGGCSSSLSREKRWKGPLSSSYCHSLWQCQVVRPLESQGDCCWRKKKEKRKRFTLLIWSCSQMTHIPNFGNIRTRGRKWENA